MNVFRLTPLGLERAMLLSYLRPRRVQEKFDRYTILLAITRFLKPVVPPLHSWALGFWVRDVQRRFPVSLPCSRCGNVHCKEIC